MAKVKSRNKVKRTKRAKNMRSQKRIQRTKRTKRTKRNRRTFLKNKRKTQKRKRVLRGGMEAATAADVEIVPIDLDKYKQPSLRTAKVMREKVKYEKPPNIIIQMDGGWVRAKLKGFEKKRGFGASENIVELYDLTQSGEVLSGHELKIKLKTYASGGDTDAGKKEWMVEKPKPKPSLPQKLPETASLEERIKNLKERISFKKIEKEEAEIDAEPPGGQDSSDQYGVSQWYQAQDLEQEIEEEEKELQELLKRLGEERAEQERQVGEMMAVVEKSSDLSESAAMFKKPTSPVQSVVEEGVARAQQSLGTLTRVTQGDFKIENPTGVRTMQDYTRNPYAEDIRKIAAQRKGEQNLLKAAAAAQPGKTGD